MYVYEKRKVQKNHKKSLYCGKNACTYNSTLERQKIDNACHGKVSVKSESCVPMYSSTTFLLSKEFILFQVYMSMYSCSCVSL